jgi:hypothetical protein
MPTLREKPVLKQEYTALLKLKNTPETFLVRVEKHWRSQEKTYCHIDFHALPDIENTLRRGEKD